MVLDSPTKRSIDSAAGSRMNEWPSEYLLEEWRKHWIACQACCRTPIGRRYGGMVGSEGWRSSRGHPGEGLFPISPMLFHHLLFDGQSSSEDHFISIGIFAQGFEVAAL